jgi:uncharacterized protein YqgC (DUF456 family)
VDIVGLVVVFLVLALGLLTMLLGLPGSILIFLDALIYGACTGFEKVTWGTLAILFVLMVAAETLDNVLGLAGARRAGAAGSSQFLCLLGGIVGAVLGGQILPLLGALGLGLGPVGAVVLILVGPLTGAFVGAAVATYYWERRLGKPRKQARAVAKATVIGRAAGTLLKFAIGVVMAAIVVAAVL